MARPAFLLLLLLPFLLLAGMPARAAAAADVSDVVPNLNASRVAPGPQALQVDPSSILNFDGTVGLAYLFGRATDGTGRGYSLQADMRLFKGTYVAADATRKQGTFGFI